LVENILEMNKLAVEDISQMGKNARMYYDENFERSFLFKKIENIFKTMCLSTKST
jgi:hypothetical protein